MTRGIFGNTHLAVCDFNTGMQLQKVCPESGYSRTASAANHVVQPV